MSTVALVRAGVPDCEAILQMQKASFAVLLEKYQDYDINPANETAAKIMARLLQPETYYYWITAEGARVGAIRIVDAKDGSRKRISPLFILPQYRNHGYAQAAMREAERIHGASDWSLSTIMQEPGNCHLYEKMGYHRTGEPQIINERMTIIHYKKDAPASAEETMIKEISKADIPACVQIIRNSFQTVADTFGFTAENAPRFTAFATDDARMLYWMQEQHRPMFGFFADGKPVGYYNLLPGADAECELGSLCVLPAYRHSGIGGQLLNDALKRAAGMGCRIMKLSIVEENTVLRKWYEGFGFVHTGHSHIRTQPYL